uniref:PA14 domain-containing protein n=1 Tax=Pavo cristatus TaxID=9049 RepID=A0A8C9EYI7_PAVCR
VCKCTAGFDRNRAGGSSFLCLFSDPPFPSSAEIASVFPAGGSLAGGTDLTIVGDFFEEPMQVTAAGNRRNELKVSVNIRSPFNPAERFCFNFVGNRGLLFEVWDGASDLTEAGPGYRWQFVPNAQSPVRFLSAAKQSFSSRLRGFFVAPQTNNYTFWIQADGPASLYLSSSQDPQHKVRIASLPAGNLEWSGKWVKNWSESWQPKSQKLELTAGLRYYLEALHHGKAPSNGMRVGVQIHNTWLNPQVVNNYYIERHEIRAQALCLPDVQVSAVYLAPVQTAIEELLSAGCDIEPTSAKILFHDGFEKEGKHVVYGTEPFCGRFSARSPSQLVKASPSSLQRYDLTEYTHVCFAHKGHMSNILHISVSYTNLSLCSVERNLTCQWDFDGTDPTSWTFSCTDLWTACVSRSVPLQDLPINTPVLVHQIDLLSTQQKESAGSFYLDEVIITDRAVSVSQRDPKPRRLGGRIIEAVTVVGSSPTYNVSWLVSGCGASLPLLSLRCALIGMTIPTALSFADVSVHISSHQLRQLLQANTDSSTAPYFNTSDFIVTKDSESCYESIWTLTWRTKTGDLPDVINVSAESLTGLKPAVSSRVVYDGGVFIGPIFGDMLATSNNKTQVVVVVNDVPANCSGSCSFQFSQEMTPLVSDVEYSAGNGALVVIRGVGFSEENTTLQVQVKNTTCYIVMSDQTKVVCKMERLPLGVHQLTLLVRPYGFALNASTGEGIFLRVEPRLVAIEPPRASEIGGLRVALRGTGLEGVNLVLFGSQPCPVLEDTRSSTRIECKVPSRGAEGAAVHVTLVSGYQSTTVTNLFQYDPSLNPAVVSLSRNRSGLAGEKCLSANGCVGHHLQPCCYWSDIKVQIGGMWAQIQAQMDSGLNVTLPALAAGWYNVSVIISGVALASNRCVNVFCCMTITVTPRVTSVFPSQGSICGGVLLTISGIALRSRRDVGQVSLDGNYSCELQSSDNNTIKCVVLPGTHLLPYQRWAEVSWALNVTVTVNGISSVCLGDCTLHLHEQSTPLVDAVTWETNGTYTDVTIKGQRLAWPGDSPVVHVNDQAVCKVTFWNETSIRCWMDCISPGEHNISISNRRSGRACFRSTSSVLTTTPQVHQFYPQNFSTNGGGLLTFAGAALKGKSRTSVLIGQQPCLILSVTCVAIQCTVPPGNGTRALRLTVDGISYDIGKISYSEESTPTFLSLVVTGLLLTINVSQVTEMDTIHVFVGGSACRGVTIAHSELQCSPPLLPAGEYPVLGLDVPRGWASSSLTFLSQLMVTAVRCNWGGLNGGVVHLHGTGFSPGQTLVTICGSPCEMLGNATTTSLSCLAPRLHALIFERCCGSFPTWDIL